MTDGPTLNFHQLQLLQPSEPATITLTTAQVGLYFKLMQQAMQSKQRLVLQISLKMCQAKKLWKYASALRRVGPCSSPKPFCLPHVQIFSNLSLSCVALSGGDLAKLFVA